MDRKIRMEGNRKMEIETDRVRDDRQKTMKHGRKGEARDSEKSGQ